MSPTSLTVIIDVQPGYEASGDENMVTGIVSLCGFSREQNMVVAVMEMVEAFFGNCAGDTDKRITSALNGLSPVWHLSKSDLDGSPEIERTCEEERLQPEYIVLAGLDIDSCVKETALGLLDRFPHATVIVFMPGCSDHRGIHWENFPQHERLALCPDLASLHRLMNQTSPAAA